MNIREYLSLNRNKIVLAFDKKDIKDLLNFKEIAKNETTKGIIVSGKYIGFTDTYRLFAVEDTDKERKSIDTANLYSITLLNEFFNISLSTSNSAIKFSNCNITYIVMPMRLL